MKKIIALLFAVFLLNNVQAQEHISAEIKQGIITLARFYKENSSSGKDATREAKEKINSEKIDSLELAKQFFLAVVDTDKRILSKKYLSKPEPATLRNIFLAVNVNWNLYEDTPKDNDFLIDSLANADISDLEMLSTYYGTIFGCLTNKVQPFNLKKIDFNLNEYGLTDATERSIFFLRAMERFGALIWGYINIPNPPNFQAAVDIVRQYPSFNHQPYYEFKDLEFPDFLVITDKRRPKESFKQYYIGKYLENLYYYAGSLEQTNHRNECREVISKSILNDTSYLKYSANRTNISGFIQHINAKHD